MPYFLAYDILIRMAPTYVKLITEGDITETRSEKRMARLDFKRRRYIITEFYRIPLNFDHFVGFYKLGVA